MQQMRGSQGVALASVRAPELRVLRLVCCLRTRDPVELPPFSGATLRGFVQGATRDRLCVLRLGECGGCLRYARCGYGSVWEPRAVEEAGGLGPVGLIPRAFPRDVCARRLPVGTELEAVFHVVGEASAFVVDALQGVRRACATAGLGGSKARVRLERVYVEGAGGRREVWTEEGLLSLPWVLPEPWRLTLRVLGQPVSPVRVVMRTPLHLPDAGRRGRGPARFDPVRVFGGFARRVEALAARFEGHVPDPRWSAAVERAAERVRVRAHDARMMRVVRWSGAQQRYVRYEGLVGQVELERVDAALLGVLLAAPRLHLGQRTHLGLGQVEVVFLSS